MNGATAAPPKVAIVGAGSVGATLAYACLIKGAGKTVALYDLNADKTRAEVLDLNHGLQFVPTANVMGSDDIEVCRDADVVVITAGAKQKPGQTRLDLAEANVNMCRTLVPARRFRDPAVESDVPASTPCCRCRCRATRPRVCGSPPTPSAA